VNQFSEATLSGSIGVYLIGGTQPTLSEQPSIHMYHASQRM